MDCSVDSIDIGLLRDQLERIATAFEVLCDIQDPDERYHARFLSR